MFGIEQQVSFCFYFLVALFCLCYPYPASMPSLSGADLQSILITPLPAHKTLASFPSSLDDLSHDQVQNLFLNCTHPYHTHTRQPSSSTPIIALRTHGLPSRISVLQPPLPISGLEPCLPPPLDEVQPFLTHCALFPLWPGLAQWSGSAARSGTHPTRQPMTLSHALLHSHLIAARQPGQP